MDDVSSSSSCAGCCSKAEPEIQALLDQISSSISANPPKFLGFDSPPPPQSDSDSDPIDCSDLFRRRLQNLDSSKLPLCPDLKKQIEAPVLKLLLDETRTKDAVTMGSVLISNSNLDRRKKRGRGGDDVDVGLVDMLKLLKDVAINPCDNRINEDEEWKSRVRRARKAMFLRADEVPDPDDFPYRKKQKSCKFLSATDDDPHSLRRSQRTILKLSNSELPRKRVPIGPSFQADVPEWKGPSTMEDMDNSICLGTQIWPLVDDARRIKKERFGNGRPRCIYPEKAFGNGRSYLCDCISPGSVACVKFHVNMARLHLKSDLGPAFFSLGFAEMGEVVSKSWTKGEQSKFDDIVRQNPSSEGKSFLESALKHFKSKSRKDIVSYYFNIFIPRWMSIRTRSEACTFDTSDDESFGWDEQNCHVNQKQPK